MYICLLSFFKMQISKKATLTDSPFSKWEPADYPMRDWPFSNVRGTKQRHTRTNLNEGSEGLPVPAQMHNWLSHKRWLNFRYKKRLTLRTALFLNGCLRGWPTSNVRGTPCYSRRRVQQASLAARQRPAEQRAKDGEFGCISSGMCIWLLQKL